MSILPQHVCVKCGAPWGTCYKTIAAAAAPLLGVAKTATPRAETERSLLLAVMGTLVDYPQVDALRFIEAATRRYLDIRDKMDLTNG